MLKHVAVLAGWLAVALAVSTAEAGKKKLLCGDHDGVPSHNDCAPVSAEKEAKGQKWISAHQRPLSSCSTTTSSLV
ncbi:MAG: hypothetical protein ACREDO_08845 [Methyloceanibacter sp.]